MARVTLAAFAHGGNVHAVARMLGLVPEDLLDFSASINPLGMPPRARAAYSHALRQVENYPEPHAESLVQALAEHLALDPPQIVAGNGSTQLIHALPRALPLRRVLLVAPLFGEYRAAFDMNGVECEYFVLRAPTFTLEPERLACALTKTHYDAVVVTNPNSPTGALIPRTGLEEIVRTCRQVGTTLIVDEAFIDWHEEESLAQVAARTRGLVVLRSLTKFFALPGLRLGYAVGHPVTLHPVRRQIEPWSVNVVAQAVGRACLHDQEFSIRSRAFMVQECAWLFARLQSLPWLTVFPTSANFLLLRIDGQRRRASFLAKQLASKGLLVRVCDNFHGLGRQFLRVAVRRRVDNRRLVAALADLLM